MLPAPSLKAITARYRRLASFHHPISSVVRQLRAAKLSNPVVVLNALTTLAPSRRLFDVVIPLESVGLLQRVGKVSYEYVGYNGVLSLLCAENPGTQSEDPSSFRALACRFARCLHLENTLSLDQYCQSEIQKLVGEQQTEGKNLRRRIYDLVQVFGGAGLVEVVRNDEWKDGIRWLLRDSLEKERQELRDMFKRPVSLDILMARLSGDQDVILMDGAWGTELQKSGIDRTACYEEWNVSNPDAVRQIACSYFQAGSDVCLTNTFGANRHRLIRHDRADAVHVFNVAGARLSIEAAASLDPPRSYPPCVFGSIGPTCETIDSEDAKMRVRSAFREQMMALREGGVGAVCIETMFSLHEAIIATEVAKELELLCLVSMTYTKTPRGYQTLADSESVLCCTQALEAAGADIIGANCGQGCSEMIEVARELRSATKKPICVRPNAGLPEMTEGGAVYKETAEQLCEAMRVMISELGVNIVGGCCGTTPEYVRLLRELVDSCNSQRSAEKKEKENAETSTS